MSVADGGGGNRWVDLWLAGRDQLDPVSLVNGRSGRAYRRNDFYTDPNEQRQTLAVGQSKANRAK